MTRDSTSNAAFSLAFRSSPEVSVISSKSSILSLPLHEHHPLHYFSLFSALLLELTHVQVAPSRLPFLRLLDAQRRHQPEARLAVGEDPHHPTAALYLLVEPLLAVGRADAPLVALGEGQASETLLDVLLKVLCDLLVAALSP